MKRILKPNTKIYFGIVLFAILIIYVIDRFVNELDIRIIDWIGWTAFLLAGLTLIVEGIKEKKLVDKLH